eukprot:XP_015584460.1 growth-regulating factor 9 isoform X1 [Ricinus communis]
MIKYGTLKVVVQVKKAKEEEEELASSMNLIIGIGAAEHHDSLVIVKHEKPLLTAAQLNELKLQVSIYEYIAAGLPVPSALVFPIWKSFAASFHSCGSIANAGIRPSFVGYNPQEFDHRNLMDPDSGRCRRTDGKKWRCKKIVVTGQKYCERHMHRGRHRSRKPVEASQVVAASEATSLNNSTKISENSSTISTPASLSNHVNSATRTTNVDTKIMTANTTLTAKDVGCVNAKETMITSTVLTDSTIGTATMGTNKSSSNGSRKINGIDDKKGNCGNNANLKNLTDRGNNGKNIINASSATPQGMNFSPKSVLQVEGCSSACFCRSDAELETGRCRRTDGKKWRCRRDVVPNEKYCKMHMHRGAKKRREGLQSLAHLNATTNILTSIRLQSTTVLPNKEDSTYLNTNLSISISAPANPQLAINNDLSNKTISSSSSTTISDTIAACCEDIDFSS